MTECPAVQKEPLDFIDAGAGDDEPVKGVCQGHLRRWHDELVDAYGLIKELAPRSDFRWLIEAPGQLYLTVQRLSMSDNFKWTRDHNRALAFRSKDQADALMTAVRQMDRATNGFDKGLFAFEATLGNAVPVEHGWLTTPDPTRFSTAWEREEYEREKAAKRRQRDLEVALWAAWKELNEIRARDGVPWTHQQCKAGVSEEYFSQVVDACAFVLGDDTTPWPAKRWLEQDGKLMLPGSPLPNG